MTNRDLTDFGYFSSLPIDGITFAFSRPGVFVNLLTYDITDESVIQAFRKAKMLHLFISATVDIEKKAKAGWWTVSDEMLDMYLGVAIYYYAQFVISLPMPVCVVIYEALYEAERRRAERLFRESIRSLKPPDQNLRLRPGYVYLIRSVTGHYKIGRTKSPENRMATFGTKLPFEVEYEHLIHCVDMYEVEAELHQRYAAQRINGEWFNLTGDHVKWIKAIGDKVGRWLGEPYIEQPAA